MGWKRPTTAPVGSPMIDSRPTVMTSNGSMRMVAPSSFAFAVVPSTSPGSYINSAIYAVVSPEILPLIDFRDHGS